MDITGKIAQANGRLKAGNLGVQIQQIGDRLYLRATLPPKPGNSNPRPHQQRISLGVRANPAGLKQAEAEARKVGALLACREFDWAPYLNLVEDSPQNCGELIEGLRQNYRASETTWQGDYLKIFKLLPQEKPLTQELVERTIQSLTPDNPNSRTRERAAIALGRLCRFAGLEYDPAALAGKYSPSLVEPRDLPTDEDIVKSWKSLENLSWAWFYGMVATYGLRPHECFHIKEYEWPIIRIDKPTKTGERAIWPFYPEWVEQFHLQEVLIPPIKLDRSNEAIGRACTHYFWKKLPFNLYSLRHRWAVRTLEFGLDISLSAQQMGHSVATHSRIYHRWIGKDVHQRAFEALIANPNRPIPPTAHLLSGD
ncbi:hypothetical protein BST81_25360 [Leptolyngbya sp. 'hensonii']|uniref:hypothetical protein n=1 Tax=Leptolyngbya sp. 'hensonii' TaxID=1922337 RepID=UPI00094F9577|nr:hypothetical protein [Leptolyngbya sp. 'hensonii']OLP15606.1 hypothetical protein BST81_25360 [Leptolyngbya sp. 'hensonii']